jgi:hypothetical protein
MTVAVEQVALFLGRADDTVLNGSIGQAIKVVTLLAKAYVRGGEDWEPDDEIEAVIVTAAARLVTNPGVVDQEMTAGPFSRSLRGGFTGWTLAELAVLNRHRRLAM